MKRSSLFFWIGIPCLLFAWFIVTVGWSMLERDAKFAKEGVQTAATVRSKRIEDRWNSQDKRNDTYYYVTYEFSLPDGAVQTSEVSTGKAEYSQAESGKPIEVVYLPSDPEQNRLVSNSEATAGYLICGMGVIVGLLGFGFLFYEIKVRRQIKHLLENGMASSALVSDVSPGTLSINEVIQWRVFYTYKDHQGRSFEGKSQYMAPELAQEWKSGDTGQIRYDKNDPNQSLWLGKRA